MTYAFKVPGGPDTCPMSTATTFVRPFNSAIDIDPTYERLKDKKSDSLSSKIKSRIPYANKEKTLVFLDNPLLTDVTQEIQTDLKHILSSHPDVSGLSLLLEDPASMDLPIQLEDFLPPTQYTDIFDLRDFIDNAHKRFSLLPASVRKKFNNSPYVLAEMLQNSKTKADTLALLENYLLNPDDQSNAQPAAQAETNPAAELNSKTQKTNTQQSNKQQDVD